MGEFWWVLIPVVAILAGTFKEYLKVSSTQRNLGTSTDHLETEVKKLKQELESYKALEERIANLEVIVTSETWDVLNNKEYSLEDKKLLLGEPANALKSDAERIEEMAKKIR